MVARLSKWFGYAIDLASRSGLNSAGLMEDKPMDRRTLVERLAKGRMRLPLIVAPMFLVSGPELVAAARAAGVSASFPFPNARTLETLDGWLEAACATQGDDHPPFAANMLTHRSYDRLADEL
ncbi:MAG: hypothetical protein AAFR11_12870, partial [Pseudomonadota bacterium]